MYQSTACRFIEKQLVIIHRRMVRVRWKKFGETPTVREGRCWLMGRRSQAGRTVSQDGIRDSLQGLTCGRMICSFCSSWLVLDSSLLHTVGRDDAPHTGWWSWVANCAAWPRKGRYLSKVSGGSPDSAYKLSGRLVLMAPVARRIPLLCTRCVIDS
jgi:hypothetical protein